MIGLDSSVWIEFFKAPDLWPSLEREVLDRGGDPERLVVPATVAFETQRWLIRTVEDEGIVDALSALLDQHDQVAIDARIARRAALTSITTGLAAADATILAATRSRFATLLTFDRDFEGLEGAVVLDR